MHDHNAEAWLQSSPIVVSELLTKRIERILDGRPDADFVFAFSVPPAEICHVKPCDFCRQLTLTVSLVNGREYDAEVDADDQMELLVDVANPHSCPASQRHAAFLRRAEADAEFAWLRLETAEGTE
jgi:hypothetical protein